MKKITFSFSIVNFSLLEKKNPSKRSRFFLTFVHMSVQNFRYMLYQISTRYLKPFMNYSGLKIRKSSTYTHTHIHTHMHPDASQKVCESGFSYCFLTDFTKFFLRGSTLLDFDFLTEEASWILRFLKIWYHNKKNKKIQIRLKFKGLDRFSQNLVSNIIQY